MAGQTHWIECTIIKAPENGKALLVEHQGENIWIPWSQIEDISDANWQEGQTLDIEITDWIARKKGLVE